MPPLLLFVWLCGSNNLLNHLISDDSSVSEQPTSPPSGRLLVSEGTGGAAGRAGGRANQFLSCFALVVAAGGREAFLSVILHFFNFYLHHSLQLFRGGEGGGIILGAITRSEIQPACGKSEKADGLERRRRPPRPRHRRLNVSLLQRRPRSRREASLPSSAEEDADGALMQLEARLRFERRL